MNAYEACIAAGDTAKKNPSFDKEGRLQNPVKNPYINKLSEHGFPGQARAVRVQINVIENDQTNVVQPIAIAKHH